VPRPESDVLPVFYKFKQILVPYRPSWAHGALAFLGLSGHTGPMGPHAPICANFGPYYA